MFCTLLLIDWLSLYCLVLLLELWSVLSFGPYFFVLAWLLLVRSLRYLPGQGNPLLWRCLWGRGPRGNSVPCLALGCLSVTSPTTHKQIGPFWCWFPGGWACVRSRILWVSPTNSPVKLGVFSFWLNPHRCFQSEVLRLYFPALEPWLWSLSHSPPSLSASECGTAHSASCCLAASLLCPSAHLHPSYPSGWIFLL